MATIDRSGTFVVQPFTLKSAQEVQFTYDCAQFGTFAETVTFPPHTQLNPDEDAALAALLNLLAVFMGVSTYKSAAFETIEITVPLSPSAQEATKALYTEGLGEFFARNELDYPPKTQFNFNHGTAPVASTSRELDPNRPILAFGGGKDSHVAYNMLTSKGLKPELVSVILSDKVQTRLSSMTDQPITFIQRTLDQRLIELNKSGEVFNGHIPITAINSLILAIYAHLTGSGQVIFANEAGASVPTLEYLGQSVNHQYSKSYAFEGLLRTALKDIAPEGPDYFSLLRPVSELWIAQQFALKAQSSWDKMASCNRNFVFAGPNALPHNVRWCGECAKCVFVALILAPFLAPQDHIKIFEVDVLDLEKNILLARDLIGLGTAKPWECVGDIKDTFACLHIAAHDAQWAAKSVLMALKSELDAIQPLQASRAHFDVAIASRGPHFVPDTLTSLFA